MGLLAVAFQKLPTYAPNLELCTHERLGVELRNLLHAHQEPIFPLRKDQLEALFLDCGFANNPANLNPLAGRKNVLQLRQIVRLRLGEIPLAQHLHAEAVNSDVRGGQSPLRLNLLAGTQGRDICRLLVKVEEESSRFVLDEEQVPRGIYVCDYPTELYRTSMQRRI